MVFLFFLMIRRPPRSTRIDTLVPYTTLFRSHPVPAVYAVLTNDMHLVALAPHRVGGHIVRDDPVTSLARELRLRVGNEVVRSEEHTSELQSLMRTSYAVFCLTKQKHTLQLLKHYHYDKYSIQQQLDNIR